MVKQKKKKKMAERGEGRGLVASGEREEEGRGFGGHTEPDAARTMGAIQMVVDRSGRTHTSYLHSEPIAHVSEDAMWYIGRSGAARTVSTNRTRQHTCHVARGD